MMNPTSLSLVDSQVCFNRTSLTLMCLIFIAVGGCSDVNHAVSGKVLYDDQPVADGRIALRPKEKSTSSRTLQAVISDGVFSFSGSQKVAPGIYDIVITGRRKSGQSIPAEEGSGEIIDRYEQYLPARYNTHTELIIEVDGDKSDLIFELTP